MKQAVDWAEQWALFAENFREGMARIDLARFGTAKTLLLKPGAGFGDLSHPTTHLMLETMQGRVAGETIVDIGTGSGILACASLLMGAKEAIGIDLDEEALAHAQENGELNGLSKFLSFSKKPPFPLLSQSLFLMNMILPEQQIFHPPPYNSAAKFWIVSGILAEQREKYLQQTQSWGWSLEEERNRSGWLGFVFKTIPRGIQKSEYGKEAPSI